MAWSFRRGINLGPLRINLSRKGAGFSVGARGFRIGRDASGRKYTQASIPNTGIYRRDYYQTPSGQPNPSVRSKYMPTKYFWLLTALAVCLWVLLKLLR
jgi:hypothetical protein